MVPVEPTPNAGANFDRSKQPNVGDVAFAYREVLLRLKDRMGNDLPHTDQVNEAIDLLDEAALKMTVVINRELRFDRGHDPAIS
jgi:hypothetical protein